MRLIRSSIRSLMGRVYEMPSLMARICGICPVSHLVASAKAGDSILATRIPLTAAKLRRILNLAQIVQSHALSFFHLSSPDFLLGMDSDPAKRNIFGVFEANPALARDGIRLRQIGQQIIEWMAGKRIHPAWVVAGGVSEPLPVEVRDKILAMLPEALKITQRTLDWFKGVLDQFREASAAALYGNCPQAVLITVSAPSFDFGDSLSPVVAAALPKVFERVLQVAYSQG